MPSKKEKADFAANAAKVVSKAIGEDLFSGEPLPIERSNTVVPGRAGGLRGGNARAAKLTPEKRREIAKKAASSRWKK